MPSLSFCRTCEWYGTHACTLGAGCPSSVDEEEAIENCSLEDGETIQDCLALLRRRQAMFDMGGVPVEPPLFPDCDCMSYPHAPFCGGGA